MMYVPHQNVGIKEISCFQPFSTSSSACPDVPSFTALMQTHLTGQHVTFTIVTRTIYEMLYYHMGDTSGQQC